MRFCVLECISCEGVCERLEICHKCYAYGHMMRECAEKERLCQRCGMSGHMVKDCKKECVCRNCKIRGNKCDHSVLSDKCPKYKRALERERTRINDE